MQHQDQGNALSFVALRLDDRGYSDLVAGQHGGNPRQNPGTIRDHEP